MFPHHSDKEQNSELLKLFREQQAGTRARQYSAGRVSGNDEGDLAFKLGVDADKQLVAIEFPKPVAWLAMSPEEAVQLAQQLIKSARSLKPVTVTLH